MQEIEALINDLDKRMRHDRARVNRWRIAHRTNGILFNLVLIIAPAALAVGLTSSEDMLGKALLFAIAVVGGLNATFKPYLHSQRRRTDMNAMRRLHDEFQAEMAKASAEGASPISVYQKYSLIFSNIYELRGRELIDATLNMTEQREFAGKDSQQVVRPK